MKKLGTSLTMFFSCKSNKSSNQVKLTQTEELSTEEIDELSKQMREMDERLDELRSKTEVMCRESEKLCHAFNPHFRR